jgi:hypothetical protein
MYTCIHTVKIAMQKTSEFVTTLYIVLYVCPSLLLRHHLAYTRRAGWGLYRATHEACSTERALAIARARSPLNDSVRHSSEAIASVRSAEQASAVTQGLDVCAFIRWITPIQSPFTKARGADDLFLAEFVTIHDILYSIK